MKKILKTGAAATPQQKQRLLLHCQVGTTEPLDAGFQGVEEQQSSLKFKPKYASAGSGRNPERELLPGESQKKAITFNGLFDNDKKRKPSGRNR